MIAVFVDTKLKRFQTEIRYTFDFILQTAGYQYKYINSLKEADADDVIFFYGLIQPTEQEIEALATDRSMFFIPSEPDLLQPGLMNRDTIEQRIIEVKYLKDIPIITEKEFDVPIVYFKNKELFFGSFNFDLIGNIFFHLADYEFTSITIRNSDHLLPDKASCFLEFSHKPFVNVFIWLLNEALKDSIKERNKSFLLKKCYWPQDEPYAAAISHSVDSLKKWSFSSLIKSMFQDLLLFYKVSHFFKNGLRRLKYIVTNIEEYWNFDLIAKVEQDKNIKSTFFWGTGTEQKDEFDYTFKDPDLVSELQKQLESGNEAALLGSPNSYREDLLNDQKQILMTYTNSERIGIRQARLRYDPNITPEYHSKYLFLYDSSRAFTDRNGFKGGLAFPFYHLEDAPSSEEREFDLFRSHNCLELPLVFSDDHLQLSEFKNIPFEQARDKMAALTRILKFYNGLITFDYSPKNFADIPYNKNLFQETIDQIIEDKAYLNTYKGIADWWLKRENVVVKQNRNGVIIYFPDSLEFFTLDLLGDYSVVASEGYPLEYKQGKICFNDIKADSTVKIQLTRNEA